MTPKTQKLYELAAAFEHSFHQNKLNPNTPLEVNQMERLIGAIFLVGANICERLDIVIERDAKMNGTWIEPPPPPQN